MDRAGLITLEQARAAGLSFDEPEPRACPHCGAALEPLGAALAGRVLMFTKNWSEGTAVENLDQRSSRRPSHGIQRGAEKERPRDIHQVRP